MDKGELSVYVVKQRRALGLFWMICRMAFGKVNQARDVEHFRLTEFQVRSKTSRLPVALDGEVEFMHPPLHYRSRPGALRVITLQVLKFAKTTPSKVERCLRSASPYFGHLPILKIKTKAKHPFLMNASKARKRSLEYRIADNVSAGADLQQSWLDHSPVRNFDF